jgi:hypothetical protein
MPCVACESGSTSETLRRFDKRSDVFREELRPVPIEVCGAETLWRPVVLLRDLLPVVVRLPLTVGICESGGAVVQ